MHLQAEDSWREAHDYYEAKKDKSWGELLHNVEKYHLEQGIAAYKSGRLSYAQADLDFILRYFPNHPQALFYMSKLTLRSKTPEKAEKYFRNAIKLFPLYSSSYTIYGIFLHKQGKYTLALENYQKALQIEPTNPEIHYNIGLTYVAIKDYANAKQHADKAYAAGFPLPGLQKMLKNHTP